MTTHIDEWLDTPSFQGPECYAKFVLMYKRMPAWCQSACDQWMAQHKLFCTRKGRRYRVTGASRLGDVWLVQDFARDHGHDLRVDVDECSDWSDAP